MDGHPNKGTMKKRKQVQINYQKAIIIRIPLALYHNMARLYDAPAVQPKVG